MHESFATSQLFRLDSQYRRALATAWRNGIRPADPLQTSLGQARRDADRWHSFWQIDVPELRNVFERSLNGPAGPVTLRFFNPNRCRHQPLAIYFHGGGFVLNGLATHEKLMRDLAVRADLIVCGVEYSLAPEHRYPVQVEEALASVRWILQHADELGVRRDRIALCGDSAGANLALSAACSLRDEAVPISFLLLLYGMFDPDLDAPSHHAFGDGSFGLSTARVEWFWRQYLADDDDRSNRRAAPLFADLHDLPPTLVIAAGLDCLRDDSIRLATRLEAADVPHVLSVYEDMPHGFAVLASAVLRADDAVFEAAAALGHLKQRHGYDGWAAQHQTPRSPAQALGRAVAYRFASTRYEI